MLWTRRRRAGNTLLFMGVGGVIMFLGFTALVIDIGLVLQSRTRMQHGADAAVLAGVQSLPGDPAGAARTAAQYFLANQELPTQGLILTPSGVTGTTTYYHHDLYDVWVTYPYNDKDTQMEVRAARDLEFLFARIFGFEHTSLRVRAAGGVATATKINAVGTNWLMPWIISLQGDPNDPNDDLGDGRNISSLTIGQTYTLKFGCHDNCAGNFGPIALGGSGGNTYRNNIINGAQATLQIGDLVATEPGNQVGPTGSGLNTRLDYPDRRRVVIPVSCDPWPLGRSDPMRVIGFVAMDLLSYKHHGQSIQLTARYLFKKVWGTSEGPLPPPEGNGSNVLAPALIP